MIDCEANNSTRGALILIELSWANLLASTGFVRPKPPSLAGRVNISRSIALTSRLSSALRKTVVITCSSGSNRSEIPVITRIKKDH